MAKNNVTKTTDREPPRVGLEWEPDQVLKLEVSADWTRIELPSATSRFPE